MDKDYFMNGGIPIPWSTSGLNCTSDQSFMDSVDKFPHFDSSFSSMPPSSAAAAASDAFILRELIGKLGGGIGSSTAFPPAAAIPFSGANNTNATNDSGYRAPPPPPLHSLSGDPGFAERAAKFSCFGSRSFNGRTPPPFDGVEPGCRSANPSTANANLHRVSSSPCLNPPPPENKNSRQPQLEKLSKLTSGSVANSNDSSSVSEQIPSGETGSKTSNELNSRKRKVVSRAKDKSNPAKVDANGNTKRSKADENGKHDEEEEDDENEKQKSDKKPPEPPKDYIHVRARRGQATDSHSLAERVRREKISERMKLLQDLVPGCNKVTGKALMLDEIINYVQSLQRQVEFLSMKLSSVNPGLDFNMENLLSKDHNTALTQQMYPLDSSSPAFYHHQPHQNVQQLHNHNNNTNNISVDPLHLGIQLSSADRFCHDTLPQFPGFSEDDLQSIVQMGFAQNPVQNQTSNMKVER